MANQKQPFRQHLVARALRGAAAAGHPNPTVEFHSPDGSKVVVRAGGHAPAVARPLAAAVIKPVKVAPAKPPRGLRPSR
jgi:hypothetical protein